MKSAIELISDERKRQVEVEKFTPERDASYKQGELALAAASYAIPHSERKMFQTFSYEEARFYPMLWPRSWSLLRWKPSPEDRLKELVKAGALIAAEIDNLIKIKNEKR